MGMQPASVTPGSKLVLWPPKIITDQPALPVFQEIASMLSGTARAEVVNHRCQVRELAVGADEILTKSAEVD